MSTFRVGQRVRVIAGDLPIGYMDGREATVIGLPGTRPDSRIDFRAYILRVDGVALDCWARAEFLRPLTDPGADAFLAKLRKLGKEPMPLTAREKA